MLTQEQWKVKVKAPYLPSKYQCDIFDWVVNGRGNAMVEAVAGSGKSSTAKFCAQLIAGYGCYMAFSNAVVREIKPAFEGTNMDVRTSYSIGFGAIRWCNRNLKIEVEDSKRKKFKYKSVLRSLENDIKRSGGFLFGRKLSNEELKELKKKNSEYISFPTGIIMSLFDKARLNLVDFHGPDYPNVLWDLANHHNLDIPPYLERVIADVIQYLADYGQKNVSLIDFTDMVWLPYVNNYKPKQYSWIFVDECQDTSPAQLALIKKCVKRGGRMLFIGDRKQAIFGFAGSNAQSFQQIIKETKAKILPLSVCYRCPTSGVEIAKEWVPQIEAHKNAPKGTIQNIKYDEMKEMVREGDMVLCRRNAPLVGAAFSIIARGIPAVVKGRSIGEGLVKTIKLIEKTNSFATFAQGIEKWLQKEKDFVNSRGGDESAIQNRMIALDDTAECLRVILNRKEITSLGELKDSISNLFSDDRSSVTLSSIHRAKGLENDRIFLLGPTEISFRGQKKWMRDQEANLSYVAHTRHKQDLVYVEEMQRE